MIPGVRGPVDRRAHALGSAGALPREAHRRPWQSPWPYVRGGVPEVCDDALCPGRPDP